MTLLFSCAAVMFSGMCLGILMLSDRKRFSRSEPLLPVSIPVRRLLSVLWLMPVMALFVVGQFSALLVWLGMVTIFGWALAVSPHKAL